MQSKAKENLRYLMRYNLNESDAAIHFSYVIRWWGVGKKKYKAYEI